MHVNWNLLSTIWAKCKLAWQPEKFGSEFNQSQNFTQGLMNEVQKKAAWLFQFSQCIFIS